MATRETAGGICRGLGERNHFSRCDRSDSFEMIRGAVGKHIDSSGSNRMRTRETEEAE